MREFQTSTTQYKFAFLVMLAAMSCFIIASSITLRDDPRFMVPSLFASVKEVFYESSFLAANAFGTASVSHSLGSDRVKRGVSAGSIPVLVYHGIVEEPDGSDINVTTEQFKEQMFALKRAGYSTLTLEELYEHGMENVPLPPRPIVITFDDGRADSYYNGDPVLASVDYKASMFIITKYAKEAKAGGYYLSPEELKIMADTGRWEIGSHSDQGHEQYPISSDGDQGNFFSNYLWDEATGRTETLQQFDDRISEDFIESKRYLETLLDRPVTTFAFPFGDLGQNQRDAKDKTEHIIRNAAKVYDVLLYQYQPGEYFTQFAADNNIVGDTLLVRRINIDTAWSPSTLLTLLEDGDQKPLPYYDSFDTNNGWLPIWGQYDISGGTLKLAARPNSAGASTIIDGTATWRDYSVTADVYSPNHTGILLWTRFRNDDNNAACNFGTTFVHAEEMRNGVKHVLKGIQFPDESIPLGPFTVTATVEGRTLICSINGAEILRTEFLDPALTTGGIGVKIWDAELGKSSIIIEQLNVEPIKSS